MSELLHRSWDATDATIKNAKPKAGIGRNRFEFGHVRSLRRVRAL